MSARLRLRSGIFNHDSTTGAITTSTKTSPWGFYAYVRAGITNDNFNFGSVMASSKAFTAFFEGIRLWPYLDSQNIPTLGYGINLTLTSIHAIAGLETALVTAVANFVNDNPTEVPSAQNIDNKRGGDEES